MGDQWVEGQGIATDDEGITSASYHAMERQLQNNLHGTTTLKPPQKNYLITGSKLVAQLLFE